MYVLLSCDNYTSDATVMLITCLSSYDGILVYFVYTLQDDQDRQVTLACGPLGIEVLMGNIQTIQIHW